MLRKVKWAPLVLAAALILMIVSAAVGHGIQTSGGTVRTEEITFTTDAKSDVVRGLLTKVDHLTDTELEEREDGLLSARLKTDSKDIYAVSRQLFFAFAEEDRPLLELNLKKASLEDIFIELTEGGVSAVQTEASVPAADGTTPEEREDEAV